MKKKIVLILTLMLCGRAMTLAFIARAGGTGPGDPPLVWLMPLLGDAVIGISGLLIAYLVLKKTGLWVWTAIIVWNAVATWDALSAYVIQTTAPWPDFFMLRIFGTSMFFAAALMHLVIIYLVSQKDQRAKYM
ncbi:MAG: hypothetical protein O3C21_10865 [Verrucomicrobia bacterium]|nr:hypothetical protein [Verrucomicrobiota bacterium]